MTKKHIFNLLFSLLPCLSLSQLTVTEVGFLPESVSNNAQCEGFINNVPYLYSFGGIDSTKTSAGIHLRSFRYDIQANTAMQLPDLPDTMGKIAAAANRIGDTIYITGGYHVLPNGNELSSNKMHRFNIATNSFMTDGPDIPEATDDHVQVVWRDSLLILITGWKNTTNIPDVQIYNPSTNQWSVGTPIPNNNIYRSFGASGSILGDTIYYFGGARSDFGFNIQNSVRRGVIDPNDPTQIEWSYIIIDPTINGYRMSSVTVGETIHWIGGSNVTYNFDGIAYNGSGGVPTSNRDLYTNAGLLIWQSDFVNELPMDLRGIADINDSIKYIAGGMINPQMVTNKVYRLTWDLTFLSHANHNEPLEFSLYPQPFRDQLNFRINIPIEQPITLTILDLSGKIHASQTLTESNGIIDTSTLPTGVYIVSTLVEGKSYHNKIVKLSEN